MVGGENIAEINCRQLREHIRVILQENYVFDSSIVKNMGYLSDCSERSEIDEMCRALGLEEVVKSNAGDLGRKSEYSFRRGTPSGSISEEACCARSICF